MCNIQAVYFTKDGSGMYGPSCNAYTNDRINEDIVVTFSSGELNKSYAACMSIKRPDNITVEICTVYRTVTSTTEIFTFGDWVRPITNLGLYTILGSKIIDTYGNTVCSGNPSGGFCQSLTISSLLICLTPAVTLTVPS